MRAILTITSYCQNCLHPSLLKFDHMGPFIYATDLHAILLSNSGPSRSRKFFGYLGQVVKHTLQKQFDGREIRASVFAKHVSHVFQIVQVQIHRERNRDAPVK